MRRAISFFVALLFIGVFGNFITMIVQQQNQKIVTPIKRTSFIKRHSQFLVDPVIKMPENAKRTRKKERSLFHIALTATDSPYSKWQCRIMYYFYKKKKDLPESDMGKFTRILHSGIPDNLMDEIPTFVVDPLPEGVDKGYVVLNRPWAFVQWLKKTTIEEEYILMAEPDHIFIHPLPNLACEGYPAAFPFFYIKPTKYETIIRKFYPKEKGPVINVDPIGNSPVIIKKDVLEKIAPTWMNVSLEMKNDPETDKKFGWVLEMYGYAVASALHGVQHILRKDFMLQPPWDFEPGKYILHYTYEMNYNFKGELMYDGTGEWRFDKRLYLEKPPPRNLSLPPRGVPQTVKGNGSFSVCGMFELLTHYAVNLIKLINEASANIPNWDTIGEVANLKTNVSR